MPLSEDLDYHEKAWLRYQERIDKRLYNTLQQKLSFYESQRYHADRFCDLQGNEILIKETQLKVLSGEQLGI